MSYILDALNKADQARKQQQESVELSPAHQAPLTQPESRYLLPGTLFALTVTGLLYWLAPSEETGGQHPAVITTEPSLIPMQPQSSVIQQPPQQQAPIEKAAAEAATEKNLEPDTNSGIQAPSENELSPVPKLMELPKQLLDALPAISISAHTYSKEKQKRMVIINNKVLHENRPVSEQLLLRNITREGVELEFNGTLFSMTTYDSWPY